MDLFPMAKKCECFLDSFVLSPSLTLGLSSYNKKTGKSSGPKSVTISTTTTLYQLLIFFLGMMLLMRALSLFSHLKTRTFYRKKMKKWRKKHRNS